MMTVHHRLARSLGGTNEPRNLSQVSNRKHKAFNLLFTGSPTPWKIAEVLNEVWIDPRFKLVVERRKP